VSFNISERPYESRLPVGGGSTYVPGEKRALLQGRLIKCETLISIDTESR